MKKSGILGDIGGIAAIMAILFGGYAYIDSRYALADDHKKLELRIDIKDLEERYRDLRREVNFLRSLKPNPQVLQEIDELQAEIADIKAQIRDLQSKKR